VTGLLFGKVPARIKIIENGHQFWVDVINGQKTGFFLDQRDKRSALMKYCKGKTVLNCFSYTGGFSVYALAAGAKRVVSVDASESALELAQENIKLNKFVAKKSELVCADVKQYLQGLLDKDSELGNNSFDVIILDPPAFIKDRHKIYEGVQGYRKINEAALRLLPAGGILVSASCSQHLSLLDFRHMLSEAAGRAGRTVQILETYTHGIDHPQLTAFTEGEYLKCVFALVN
jgi:23S rRNA (cytosine1962-C5)-methyltransferase